jgi:hypothetical protein
MSSRVFSASFEKGRLQMQHLWEAADELGLNLIQKYFQKFTLCNNIPFTES